MEYYFEAIRNNLGKVDQIIRRPDGASVLFYSATKEFDETDPVTKSLRDWEVLNGALDLSDRLPTTEPEIIEYRVNRLTVRDRAFESDRFPEDINYNTDLVIGLTTKTIDYFGLRVAQVFYQSIYPDTHEPITPIPIVFERYKYNWDEQTKLPLGRVKEIYFYLENGELSEQFKLLPKEFYNVSDRADITTRRRQTILAWLIARATELGLGKQVKDYFAVYKEQTDKYVLYADCQILKTVKESAEPWLDLDTTTSLGTVRNAIAVCFTKALEPTGNDEVTQFLQNAIN
ncbi:MAG: hypothetical protein RLZZ171_1503 [Cyanobacteriota bacterium]|jgi:hypothetical protein